VFINGKTVAKSLQFHFHVSLLLPSHESFFDLFDLIVIIKSLRLSEMIKVDIFLYCYTNLRNYYCKEIGGIFMALWRHTICEKTMDEPGQPVKCPFSTIPLCPNPTLGFTYRCLDIWECQSCGWLFDSVNQPTRCPSQSAIPCSNPTGGTFRKECD
jgi:hypothetical protein